MFVSAFLAAYERASAFSSRSAPLPGGGLRDEGSASLSRPESARE